MSNYYNRQWRLPNNENKDKQSNYSMSFDGIDDYIDLNSLDQSILNGSFTVSFWLNKTAKGGGADNDRMIDLTVSSSTSLQIITDAATNKFGVNFIQSGSSYIYRKVFNNWSTVTDSWHHIALTWDGSSYEYYFDGSSVATTGTSPIGIGGTGFYLGKRADGVASTEFKGKLDAVCIFDYALSSSQVTTLYGSSSTGIGNPMTLNPKPVFYAPLGDQDSFNGSNYLVPNSSLKDYVLILMGVMII